MAGSVTGGITFNDKKIEIDDELKNNKDFEFTSRTKNEEIKNIRLKPEQIEEINTDDYSLLLFNATRVEPLSLSQIKNYFPEPISKKAQSVMDRFISCGLVHITKEGKYYSNYPDHYIDYSLFRYDAILEAKKDARVFDLMKENCNSKTYWKDKSYFSEDGFFTDEQSKEIADALNEIRLKVKKYTSENRKTKKVSDLIFRRFKYYDMILGLMLALSFCFSSLPISAFAQGNDPGSVFLSRGGFQFNPVLGSQAGFDRFNVNPLSSEDIIDSIVSRNSMQLAGGNDPGAVILLHSSDVLRALQPYKHNIADAIWGNDDFQPVGTVSFETPVRVPLGGHDPGSVRGAATDVISADQYQAIVDCGQQLEDAEGSLVGVSPLCLRAIFLSSLKECNETGDEAYCESAQKGAVLTLESELTTRVED